MRGETISDKRSSHPSLGEETTPSLPRHSYDKARVCRNKTLRGVTDFLQLHERRRDDYYYSKEKRDFVTSHQSAALSGPDTQTSPRGEAARWRSELDMPCFPERYRRLPGV